MLVLASGSIPGISTAISPQWEIVPADVILLQVTFPVSSTPSTSSSSIKRVRTTHRDDDCSGVMRERLSALRQAQTGSNRTRSPVPSDVRGDGGALPSFCHDYTATSGMNTNHVLMCDAVVLTDTTF